MRETATLCSSAGNIGCSFLLLLLLRTGQCFTTPQPDLQPTPSASCKLPPQPENGHYKLAGCNPPCEPVPGQTVVEAVLTYDCNSDFVLSGVHVLFCEGKWSAEFPTCSRARCSALVNPSREIECKRDEKKVDCDQPMPPGTRAVVKCNAFYTHINEFADFDTTCQSDGSWSRSVHSCLPKCGEPAPDEPINIRIPGYHYWWYLANVIGTESGTTAMFPWHAGIYRDIDGDILQICGGTIISVQTIITAAHCFWDSNVGGPFDYKEFRVAVGKFYRDWSNKEEKYVQLPEIDNIVLHDRFRGDTRQWADDIAIINLKERLIMTKAVRPICVDYNKKYERLFTPGKRGIVMGWGITENQTQSETIRTVTLPFVDIEVCEKEVPPSFLAFLTNSKFCAGYRNGTSVCPGDNGGGYAMQFKDGKWYLMGLVSVGVPSRNGDACNMFDYATFTKVSDYYEFVQKYKKEYRD